MGTMASCWVLLLVAVLISRKDSFGQKLFDLVRSRCCRRCCRCCCACPSYHHRLVFCSIPQPPAECWCSRTKKRCTNVWGFLVFALGSLLPSHLIEVHHSWF